MKIIDIMLEDINLELSTPVELPKKDAKTYAITSTGSNFDASVVEPYGSELCTKILKTQQAKIDTAAKVLGIEWKQLYAHQFMQHPGYMGGNRRLVWTYVLVGEDAKGNEVSYWKYEGSVAGGGQSHMFVNKDKNTKIKLSYIIDPRNKKEASKYIQNSVAMGAKQATEKESLTGKKKLTHDEVYKALSTSPKIKKLIKDGARLVKPKENAYWESKVPWRLVIDLEINDYDPHAIAYSFKPSAQGRIHLFQHLLSGKRDVKRGCGDSPHRGTSLGVMQDITYAIAAAIQDYKRESAMFARYSEKDS